MQVKLKAGGLRVPVTLTEDEKRIYLKFNYNKALQKEVKECFERRKYHGFDKVNPQKMWSFPKTHRNMFQLAYLLGHNPYQHFDKNPEEIHFERPLRKHQKTWVEEALLKRFAIFAGEPGTGKTLSMIEVIERALIKGNEAWYVGPVAGVKAVSREVIKWNCLIDIKMFTYNKFTTYVKNNEVKAPQILVLDESHNVKNPQAQRTQAAKHVADGLRTEHPSTGIVIEMTGTPSPKSPTDWWSQCEIAVPGFIREANIHVFKKRLCVIEEKETVDGVRFPKIISWLEDENICKVCGYHKEDMKHSPLMNGDDVNPTYHPFESSKNEVAFLYKRMKGLVHVVRKKDCADLPDKQYEEVRIKPSIDTLRAARMIKNTSPRVVTAMGLLRQLSDGFQYKDEIVKYKECEECWGKPYMMKIPTEAVSPLKPIDTFEFKEVEMDCPNCNGLGEVPVTRRTIDEVPTPKDKELKDDLEQYEDIGRFIVWGGYTGTIDKLINICVKQGWRVLAVDGRGYRTFSPMQGEELTSDELLDAMDASNPRRLELERKYPRVAFVGQPKAGGIALTLTASPIMVFYSNDFDGGARKQAEDRFHRIGMDTNRACLVKDYIHLPTDKLVLDNLKRKRRLQDLTLGQVSECLEKLDGTT